MTKIFFWSDKWWSILKEPLLKYAKEKNIICEDLWEKLDYPDIAKLVCKKTSEGNGIWVLFCWTWIWMSMSANKLKWIRAALVHNCYEASMSRKHNDANVLCMWARVLWVEIAKKCLDAFLENEFEWWRHERRVNKITT